MTFTNQKPLEEQLTPPISITVNAVGSSTPYPELFGNSVWRIDEPRCRCIGGTHHSHPFNLGSPSSSDGPYPSPDSPKGPGDLSSSTQPLPYPERA